MKNDELENQNTPGNEHFLKLFMHNQSRIYGFIRSLVPSRDDCDDLMQETIMIMWDKFDEFEPGTDFAAWGIQISRFRILKFRADYQKKRLRFSGDAFEEIISRTSQTMEKIDDRVKALEACVTKLEKKDFDLIKMRYEGGITIKELAQRVGRPVHGLYKTFGRIHTLLQECVNKTMARESNSSGQIF